MPAPVLIAYATRYGATQEVAEAIAAALCAAGVEADIAPMRHVHDLEGREAVIVGAPLYMGRLHPDTDLFLDEHVDTLAALPVAVFALGPVTDAGTMVIGSREQFAAELDRHPLLYPLTTALFGGRFDPDRLRWTDRLIARLPASPLRHLPPSDIRDWEMIERWTRGLVSRLRLAARPECPPTAMVAPGA